MQYQDFLKEVIINIRKLGFWVTWVLPALLLLAFFGSQVNQIDSIGWSHGFSHPLEGWDHLVTMLAVGIWAAQMRGKAIWMLPLAFVSVMSLGGLAGAAGVALPSVEGIILLSTAVFSILITRRIRFNSKINVLIVAFFAFFHGFAHGQEISTSASLLSYTLGFMLATLLLHGAGIIVTKLIIVGTACLLSMIFAQASFGSSSAFHSNAKLNTWSDSNFLDLSDYYTRLKRLERLPRHTDVSSCQIASTSMQDTKLQLKQSTENQAKVFWNPGTKFKLEPAKFRSIDSSASLALLKSGASYHCYEQNLALIAFSDYFPEINHTPGREFNSNGVGTTSPPLHSIISATNPLESPFDLNLKSLIEAILLQLVYRYRYPIRLFPKSASRCLGLFCARILAHMLRQPINPLSFSRALTNAPIAPNARANSATQATHRIRLHSNNLSNLCERSLLALIQNNKNNHHEKTKYRKKTNGHSIRA